jgi:hypothetical protein
MSEHRTIARHRAPTLVATSGLAVAGCITAAMWVTDAFAGSTDDPTVRCLQVVTSSQGVLSASDCMRGGRHIRVDTDISRGTASLGPDGFAPTGYQRDETPRHLRVQDAPGPRGLFGPGIFGGR